MCKWCRRLRGCFQGILGNKAQDIDGTHPTHLLPVTQIICGQVAIKVLKIHAIDGSENFLQRQEQVTSFLNYTHVFDSNSKQRLKREIFVWSRLDHKNVLPLLGVITNHSLNHSPLPSMVSPWMMNGSLNKFLKLCGSSLNVEARLVIVRVCCPIETVSWC